MAVHVVHGKGGKERITYTTAVCLKHLLAYLTNRSENDGAALFYNRSHEPLNAGGIRFILNGIAKRAGVENVHPHRFRRTFATGLARRGMEVQEIQQLLGHTSIETTMRYVTVDTDKVQSSYRQYIA
jgi:site-specific recombinase XerD